MASLRGVQGDVFARLSHALSLVGSYITRRAAERRLEGLANLLVDPVRDREAIDARQPAKLVLAWDYHGATTLSRVRMRDGSAGYLVERRQGQRVFATLYASPTMVAVAWAARRRRLAQHYGA